MLHIILFQPEIPPNTGNIIRLAANTGATLHLIHPLGFALNEKTVKRAGLDYHEWSRVYEHQSLTEFRQQFPQVKLFACTTKAQQLYNKPQYGDEDGFLFGPESRGLPPEVLAEFDEAYKIKIPMQPYSRSLNLANAVSVIFYEAWRQLGFSIDNNQ